MNNPPTGHRRIPGIYLIVSLAFLILAVGLQALVWAYWSKVLEPRLYREATSQANVLAHSQAVKLADVLVTADKEHRYQSLYETVDEILLFTDPESETPLFKGVDLKVDYGVLVAPAGSLDLTHGASDCPNCFEVKVGLYSPLTDELIGIARFQVSDTLFRRLSRDVKRTLISQSLLGMLLLLVVWGAIIVLIREVNRSRHQAEAASRAKSAFLANMSHELRTPLNAIIGFSELMRHDRNLSADHRENLSIINRSGEYLLELINDVLELSKIEATGKKIVEQDFDLYETLDKVTEMIRLRAEKKRLRLNFERSADVPRYITTDERKLRQILLNLLGNSVKFTEEGGVNLRVRSERDALPDPSGEKLLLHFEIEDSGPGISDQEQETVFEPFTQTRIGYEKKEGTGLGLAITRQFVQHLGGGIRVDSEVGKGTVFGFTIRVKMAAAGASPVTWTNRRVIGYEAAGRNREERPFRLLIVDDYPENRQLLRQILEQVGFAVESAANGRQAVELNKSWQPDLIWMDMRMPVMDGYEATRRIVASRSEKPGRPVIVALTASAFKEDREAVLAVGCDDFLRRPFREAEIFAMLQKHLAVDLIYESDAGADKETNGARPGSAAWRAAIAQLPAAAIYDLRAAIELSDLERMEQLVDDIGREQSALAAALKQLMDTFQYDRLLGLLDEVDNT
jgi:signal transduction histidine kinase/DNA-binding NarL/FixJ family response regulator